MQNKWLKRMLLILGFVVVSIALFVLYAYNLIPHATYRDEDFNITMQLAQHDENQNGKDDILDILEGAKLEIADMPTYRSAYYAGGYPPKEEGVCTDVVWRALQHAGYNLKDLMDEDIASHPEAYPNISQPDPNIDFRRVPNQHMFFERHAISLPTTLSDPSDWQAGDIVVFSDSHIGVCSDIRNSDGFPFLLHNGNLPVGEEDCLAREDFLKGISGHYRFIIDKE